MTNTIFAPDTQLDASLGQSALQNYFSSSWAVVPVLQTRIQTSRPDTFTKAAGIQLRCPFFPFLIKNKTSGPDHHLMLTSFFHSVFFEDKFVLHGKFRSKFFVTFSQCFKPDVLELHYNKPRNVEKCKSLSRSNYAFQNMQDECCVYVCVKQWKRQI